MTGYEDSDFEDYPPMTVMQRKILISTSIAVAVALVCGCLVGFAIGYRFFNGTHKCPLPPRHHIGYSIVDVNTIRTCCNEVRHHHWQVSMKH